MLSLYADKLCTCLDITCHINWTWTSSDSSMPPLSVPPTMIVYVTPYSSPLTVTVAIPLVIGAVPKM